VSKIFDALRKAQGDVSEIALPFIYGAGASAAPDQLRNSEGVHHPLVFKAEPKELQVEEVYVRHLACPIIFHTDPASIAADRFRLLRMRLGECWKAGKLKTLLVTSPLPADGKSTTALNLVTALAEEKKRSVLLVDADLHRRSITQQLHLEEEAGLAECLHGRITPISTIRRIEPFGWHFLPAGQRSVASPTELLQPQELAILFQRLTSQFDWVVVDSPPVLPLSDAVALQQHVDGTLLVAKAGGTPEKAINDAIALLGRKHILGLVLNGIEKLNRSYSSYYQYSGSQATPKSDTPR